MWVGFGCIVGSAEGMQRSRRGTRSSGCACARRSTPGRQVRGAGVVHLCIAFLLARTLFARVLGASSHAGADVPAVPAVAGSAKERWDERAARAIAVCQAHGAGGQICTMCRGVEPSKDTFDESHLSVFGECSWCRVYPWCRRPARAHDPPQAMQVDAGEAASDSAGEGPGAAPTAPPAASSSTAPPPARRSTQRIAVSADLFIGESALQLPAGLEIGHDTAEWAVAHAFWCIGE